MLHVALLCLLVGQVPPPPAPHLPSTPSYPSVGQSLPPPPSPGITPGKQASPADQPPTDPQAQRSWLLARLIGDMQRQGQYDAQKYHAIEAMLNKMSPSQVSVLIQVYQQRKAQVESWQLAQAQANLRRLEAYRDYLKRELERRMQVYPQEQAITAYGSWLAGQQAQWAMQNFYAAQAWPYYFQPYYRPYRHW